MLTVAQMRCLLALHALRQRNEKVPSKDIARLLGISRPSAHRLLEALAACGLIDKPPYGAVALSEEGARLALQLENRRDHLALIFARRFGLPMDEGACAALLLMSGLREESLRALDAADTGA